MTDRKWFVPSRDELQTFFGHKAQPEWIDALAKLAPSLCAHYQMTWLRWVHWAAQTAHESSGLGLNPMCENMRYRSAARVKTVFSKRLGMALKTKEYASYGSIDALAKACVNNPEFLAGIVYGGREGTPLGCGLYIGRGPLQITHLNNYKLIAGEIVKQPGGAGYDLVKSPQLLEQPEPGVRSAFACWHVEGLAPYADKDNLAALSAKLNVGSAAKVASVIGLPERQAWLKKAKSVWPKPQLSTAESDYSGSGEVMMPKTTTDIAAPWMGVADSNKGLKEGRGKANNPKVMQFYKDCGHDEIEYDSVAWCAAFVGSCLARSGYPTPPTAQNLMARSYCTYGTKLAEPKPGAIAVFKRGKPPFGHVGFVLEAKGDTLKILGGNQGDAVSISSFKKEDAIAFRWPIAPTVAELKKAGSTEIANTEGVNKGLVAGGTATSVLAGAGEALKETPVPDLPGAIPLPDLTATAPPIPLETPPDITWLQWVTDSSGLLKSAIEGVQAVFGLIIGNPWIGGMLIGGAACWCFGVYLPRKNRLEKAAAGVPLSSEIG